MSSHMAAAAAVALKVVGEWRAQNYLSSTAVVFVD